MAMQEEVHCHHNDDFSKKKKKNRWLKVAVVIDTWIIITANLSVMTKAVTFVEDFFFFFFNGSSIALKHCSSTCQLPIQIWVVCLNPTDRWFVQPSSEFCLIILQMFVDFSPLYCSPAKVNMNQLLHTSFSPNKISSFHFLFTCICSGVSCTLALSLSSVTLSCRASRLCSLFSSSACRLKLTIL